MSTLGLRPDSIQPSVFHERLVSTCAHMLQTPLATSRTCTVRARDRKRPETVHNRSTRTDYPTMSPGGRVLCGIRDRKRPEVVHNHSTHTDFPPVGVWRRETSRPWTGRVQHRHGGGFLVRLRCLLQCLVNSVFSLSARLATGPRKPTCAELLDQHRLRRLRCDPQPRGTWQAPPSHLDAGALTNTTT